MKTSIDFFGFGSILREFRLPTVPNPPKVNHGKVSLHAPEEEKQEIKSEKRTVTQRRYRIKRVPDISDGERNDGMSAEKSGIDSLSARQGFIMAEILSAPLSKRGRRY